MSAGIPADVIGLATKIFNFAREGDTANLRLYIENGVPINLTNDKGDTLVMLSSYHGHLDTLDLLLEKGADVNRVNDRGQTPLAGAVFKGEEAIVRRLIEGGADARLGTPSAMDAAKMFNKPEYLALFENASTMTTTAATVADAPNPGR